MLKPELYTETLETVDALRDKLTDVINEHAGQVETLAQRARLSTLNKWVSRCDEIARDCRDFVRLSFAPDETFIECGGCDHVHRATFYGDCRDDNERFTHAELEDALGDSFYERLTELETE